MLDGTAARSGGSTRYKWAGYALGFSIGGFFDGILLQEWDAASGKLIGPVTNIYKGTSLGLVEGPHGHVGTDHPLQVGRACLLPSDQHRQGGDEKQPDAAPALVHEGSQRPALALWALWQHGRLRG